jgi:hypothetical protein
MDETDLLGRLRSDSSYRAQARALILTDELLRLPSDVARLADGQDRLFAGQAKLEEAVARLADGQDRLFAGQAKLEDSVARLTVGQGELFAGQDRLFAAVAALRKEVGSLSNTIGGTAEEDAADVLCYVARQRGYVLAGEPVPVDLDGDGELDLWVRARDAGGRELSLLVEAKVRLRAREVRSWAALHDDARFLESLERAGIAAPYLPYAFGIRIYPEARDAARAVGVGVLSIRGEDVAPARELAG